MSYTVSKDAFARGVLVAAVFNGAQVEFGESTQFNGNPVSSIKEAFPEAPTLAVDEAAVLSIPVVLTSLNNALANVSTVTSSSKVTTTDAFVAGLMSEAVLSIASVKEYPYAVRFFNYVMSQVVRDNKTLAALVSEKGVKMARIAVPHSQIFTANFESVPTVEKKTKESADEKKTGSPAAAVEAPIVAETSEKKKAPKEKKAAPAAAAASTGGDDDAAGNDVGRMRVVVGKVVSVEDHPTEAKLLTLQINVGLDAPIQVVAGVAEFAPKETLADATLAVITNLKPGEVKGVNSVGRCIVATSADGSVKELIRPDASCPAGEVIAYRGITQQFDAQLAPKRFHKILKSFSTNENKEVQCQGAVFETSVGVLVAATVANGTVA